MKNRKYCNNEIDLLQRLKSENKRLKRIVSNLQKQLSRIDLDRYENLKELVDKQYREDMKQSEKDKWKCYHCPTGQLKILIINRHDGTKYLRKCSNCSHRTKIQDYTKGIKE